MFHQIFRTSRHYEKGLICLPARGEYIHLCSIQAAEDGAQNTAKMQAQAGRASYIGSSILSEPDPGAVAVALWMNAIGTVFK